MAKYAGSGHGQRLMFMAYSISGEVVDFSAAMHPLYPTIVNTQEEFSYTREALMDFSVKGTGQYQTCIEIAAAGSHNAILIMVAGPVNDVTKDCPPSSS